ncbi:MAG TPA: DUF1330 domain-containing protein [Actinomycetota bacterium]|nr:DUF1330 domain-containing protein [Actinomycetota bacterium]
MPAYVICDIDVTDSAGYQEYAKQAPPTIARHGGRYLVRGGAVAVLEGEWRPNRLVILEFDSVEAARRWHSSEDYAGPKALRQKTSKGNFVVVEGL